MCDQEEVIIDIRWLITCSVDGLKSAPRLQVKTIQSQPFWNDVEIVEIKDWEDHTRDKMDPVP